MVDLSGWDEVIVVFVDDADAECRVSVPRQGHTDRDVVTVAYRWACKQIAEGNWHPHGEIRFQRLGGAM